MSETGASGGTAAKQREQPLTTAAKKLNDVNTALTKLSKVTDAAANSVKRVRKGLLDLFSFDEINRLSKLEDTSSSKSSGSRSGSGRSGGGSGGRKNLSALREMGSWLERLKKLAEQLLAPLKKIWELKGGNLTEAFQKLQESAGKLAEIIKGGLQWGYENVLLPLAEWVIGEAAPAAVEALAGAFELVASVLKVLAPIGQAIWENFLQPLAEWTGGAIVAILEGIGNVFQFLAEQIEKVADLINGDQGIFEALGSAIQDGVKNIPGVDLVIGLVTSKSPSELWQDFKEKWGSNKVVQTGIRLVKSGWSSITGFVGNKVSAAVSLVKSGWSSLTGFVGSSVSVGIKLVKKGWTSVKSWLGDLSAKFNIKLPKVSVTWSGSPIALPKFSVKWNAKGGILDGATLFGMAGNTLLGGGEAGREAILPLDRNTGWMDNLADKVAQKVSGGSGGNQTITVYVTLDGKVVGKSVVNYAIGEARATGQLPWAAYT